MFKVARGVAGQDIIHIESTSSGQPSMRACESGSGSLQNRKHIHVLVTGSTPVSYKKYSYTLQEVQLHITGSTSAGYRKYTCELQEVQLQVKRSTAAHYRKYIPIICTM